MAKHISKTIQLAPSSSVLQGQFDGDSLGEDPVAEVQIFSGAVTESAIQERLDAEIRNEVQAIVGVIRDHDAFDLIELLRMRESPVVPVLALGGGHDGSGAVIDLVSLILLTRKNRMPSAKDRTDLRPHAIIPELHHRAKRLLRLSTYAGSARGYVADLDPLIRLATEYQSYLVSVRALQYESVQSTHDEALFDRPEFDSLLTAELGFTYRDFAAVRAAIQGRYSRILTGLRDTTGDIIRGAEAEGRQPTDEEREIFREAMVAFMFLPGERASFTVADIATEAEIAHAQAAAVLSTFTMDFDGGQDAVSMSQEFLRGVNLLARRSLVRDDAGNYLMTGLQIGTDSFRVIAEDALKPDSKAWRRYDRIRADISESLAVGALERLLTTEATHKNLKYLAPRSGVEADSLDTNCTDPHLKGNQTECDGLFVIDDVAICLEVKGRTISEPARRGDTARLKTEIGKTFGDGARQARRLENLIQTNGGVWLEDRTWLDLSGIREVRSVVVGLDFFGPLAVALGDLQRSGLLTAGSLPWIASLHDLDVISKVIARPAEFLLYLRRRTDSGVATHFRGADELDLFMLFLDGGLYVEPDPDEIRRQHPTSGPPPNKRDRKQHRHDARPTVVGTHTDPLDAWMYWVEGSNPDETDKPAFNTDPSVQEIVDFLADGRKPGWFRFGADLFGISGHSQKLLGDGLRSIAGKTRSDDRWHSLAQGFAGMWGFPTFFAGTKPRSHTRQEAVEKLRSYMTAKKHQLRSDRSLGLLLTENHDIVHVIYLNNPPTDDPELDDLGSAIGLNPFAESVRPIPPSARRSSLRLRGQRGKKKRKG